MTPLAISSYTLVSAIGRGLAETARSLLENRSGLTAWDLPWARMDTFVGRVAGLEDYPVVDALAQFDCRNNRLAQMGLETDGFGDAVRAAAERYGPERVAVILGTSTSGIRESEIGYARMNDGNEPKPTFRYDTTHDYYSLTDFVRRYLDLHGPALTISTACSSSAKTFVDAQQMIGAGLCDAAVVGGVDSLCLLTMRGFASLELTSTEPCRPNDAARTGISIGEAAGFALLERVEDCGAGAIRFHGFGESSDAYHMSSPHPDGAGALAAMRAALAQAGLTPDDIDYINLHGTGSLINDKAEDAAVFSLFGDRVPCSSTKGWTGHALGSAGIAEAAISCLCISEGLVPTNLNMVTPDPSFRSQIVTESRRMPVHRVLSNSFGFGGNNCSLVLGEAA